ncbi:MAG: branched-chain amino acid transport system II carrier protein [Oligoflexales bacterium]|nr:branched-chain amino acid transport system II carrier protein [Oligoflexales bacterium]
MSKKTIVTGIALFSMFFGGGNLIYPLSTGMQGGENLFLAFVGFILSGVLLPFIGVLTVILYQGKASEVFSILGPVLRRLFPLILLAFWIPLGSAPRCISLVHTSFTQYGFDISHLFFVAIYSLTTFVACLNKSRIIDLLGYVMTPVIIVSIFAVVLKSLSLDSESVNATLQGASLFFEALDSGLKTQDFIAAFFFSSIICDLVRSEKHKSAQKRFVFNSCLIGVSLLSVVYLAMIFCGSINASLLAGLRGDQLLFALLTRMGGDFIASCSLIVITFGCLSTSIALTAVFANYLFEASSGRVSFKAGAAFTSIVSMIPALFGFELISAIISPSMEILYPLLLLVSFAAIVKKLMPKSKVYLGQTVRN